eukprot:6399966-Amphidinium_carterae.1
MPFQHWTSGSAASSKCVAFLFLCGRLSAMLPPDSGSSADARYNVYVVGWSITLEFLGGSG